MTPQAQPGWRAALRVLMCILLFGVLAAVWGDRLVEALFPLWRWELALFDSSWRVDGLSIDLEGADRVIRVQFGLAGCLDLGGHRVCGGPESVGQASTLVGNATMPVVLLLSVVLGWPPGRPGEWRRRVLGVPPAMLLLWAIDIPTTLASAYLGLWRDALGLRGTSMLTVAGNFLQSGGRIALALALAAVVLMIAHQAELERPPLTD